MPGIGLAQARKSVIVPGLVLDGAHARLVPGQCQGWHKAWHKRGFLGLGQASARPGIGLVQAWYKHGAREVIGESALNVATVTEMSRTQRVRALGGSVEPEDAAATSPFW